VEETPLGHAGEKQHDTGDDEEDADRLVRRQRTEQYARPHQRGEWPEDQPNDTVETADVSFHASTSGSHTQNGCVRFLHYETHRAGEFLTFEAQWGVTVSGSLTVLLSTLLFRTIIVGAVVLVLKFIYEGVFMQAGMLLLAISFFAYLSFTEARLLE